MKNVNKKKKIKLNLTLDEDFYIFLQEKAKENFVKTATFTKSYLMKQLLGKNNTDSNSLTQNEDNI